jgi:ferric-dicitrate binding protein FerR (iron transport regulator)
MSGQTGAMTIGLPKKQLFVPVWMKAAAVFLLLCGLSFLFYWVYQGIKPEEIKTFAVASQNTIMSHKLADNSQVVLNKQSKITYSSEYGKKNREVTLSGEAYFNVRHSADTPFVVKAEGTFIKDIGTAFNINANPSASIVEVYVEHGKVMFYTADNSGITLIRGERAIFNKKKRNFVKLNQPDINVLSYKTKVFVFQNTALFDVVNLLNSVYDKKIELANSSLTDCRITVKFDNEDIGSIVNIISETLNLKAIKTNTGYIFEGNGCNIDKK